MRKLRAVWTEESEIDLMKSLPMWEKWKSYELNHGREIFGQEIMTSSQLNYFLSIDYSEYEKTLEKSSG